MDEQLHIIITGDRGKIFRLPCSRKKFCVILACSVVTLVSLSVTSILTFSLYTKNRSISSQLVDLQEKLRNSAEIIVLQKESKENQRVQLDLKVANLELNKLKQTVAFKEEKETLISNAVSELNERSELIERIIGSIGIKLPKDDKKKNQNSGGLFIQQPDSDRDELIYKADKYLQAISFLPFGRPVNGKITSRFGKRKDPVNGKKAHHSGIDFRGKKGDKIYATADGVVKKAFRNGGYGNFVMIDHGNGYTTSFSHMQAYLVKKGEQIKRGQIIGLVGNTGRSTGPHLHYEVLLDKKPINPYNFMKIAKATLQQSPSEKK